MSDEYKTGDFLKSVVVVVNGSGDCETIVDGSGEV